MTLPPKQSTKTSSGLSEETDQFLTKLMKKNGFSIRKQKEMKQTINVQGTLPLPPKPKYFKQETKPKPEKKIFTMARIGKKPLVKPLENILEDTNYYKPEIAPIQPIGISNEEKKNKLAISMYGIDEEKDRKTVHFDLDDEKSFTLEDQILLEVQDRNNWLEQLHEYGIHEHDNETIRQIEIRLNELKGKLKGK